MLRGKLDKVTWQLTFYCLLLAVGSIIFGYDTQSFGGVNAIPGFIKQFGEEVKGKYVLSTTRLALLTSMAFVGKFFGCLVAGPAIERWNHRNVMYIMCATSYLAVVIQATAHSWIQFMFGRIVLYFAAALAENCVPVYQSELIPAPARGGFVATIALFNGFGGLIASLINRAESTKNDSASWLWPTCVQVIFPTIILCGLWSVPLSPRWLVKKGRHQEAIDVLKHVRPRADSESGSCEDEIVAIELALESQPENGPWMDLFRGTNLRRTLIATIPFIYAQLTGISFISSYGVRFFQAVGLASQAFNYKIITTVCNLVACLIVVCVIDWVGRRPMLVIGAILQGIFLFLVGGLGLVRHPNSNTVHFFAACTFLASAVYSGMWGATPYVLAAEIGSGRLREKTMAFSSAINVIFAWLISFVLPYMLNPPYADLEANVGWIFGGVCLTAAVYCFFFVPETRGRALEELDACFAAHQPARKFPGFKSTGAAGRIAALEDPQGHQNEDPEAQRKPDVEETEHKEDKGDAL